MIASMLLALFDDEPAIDVSAHLPLATQLWLAILGLLIAFFVVRPELWRRLWFDRIDPRPAGLLRIGFVLVVLWTFLDFVIADDPFGHSMVQYLFTDEGIWLNKMARKNYGGRLTTLYDPELGFEHWWSVFPAMWGKFTILHLRSDPPFVWTLYVLMLTSLTLLIFGVWTRVNTVLSWILVETMYRYSPLFYTGGDTVVRVFMFCGLFCNWGQAYSFDTWRRRRKSILRSGIVPPLRRIAAWPQRLMMLQLAVIYSATGLLKSGNTWANGTALYYTLNLDHFYRWPLTGVVTVAQYSGLLPVMTVTIRWWEALFPIALIGVAVNAFERERAAGVWPMAAAWRRALGILLFAAAWGCSAYLVGLGVYYYTPPGMIPIAKEQMIPVFTAAWAAVPVVLWGLHRALLGWFPRVFKVWLHWVLGKRLWLGIGLGMHAGIDLSTNVGTFAEVMMAVYLAWLRGDEVEAFWRYVFSRPCAPGEGARPLRKRKWLRWLSAPWDRLRWRARGRVYTVHHHPSEASVRRAALLRLWDLGGRLEFVEDESLAPETLVVQVDGEKTPRRGRDAGSSLVKIFPGLWLLWPFRRIPGLSTAVGALAMRVLHQRG